MADEVRTLAEKTNGSALEVSQIIERLTGKVMQVSDAMNIVVDKVHRNQQVAGESARVIQLMADQVAETTSASQSIFEYSNQQIENLRVLSDTLDKLFSTLTESSMKVEITANIGGNLYLVSNRLNELMADFVFKPSVTNEGIANDKRKSPRVKESLLVKITQDDMKLEGLTRDFSLIGMQFILTHKLNTEKNLNVGIYLPSGNKEKYQNQMPVEIMGQVVWQRQEGRNFHSGIQFINVGAKEQRYLQECYEFFNRKLGN